MASRGRLSQANILKIPKPHNVHSTDLFDFLCDLVDAVGVFLRLLHTQAGILDLFSEERDVSL